MNKKSAGSAIVSWSLGALCAGPLLTAGASGADLEGSRLQVFEELCVSCHNFDDYAGGLDLSLVVHDPVTANAEEWEKVIRKMRAGMMPPPGQPRPEFDDYMALVEWLESEIDAVAVFDPGTKPIHRLNRNEYANAIRDLLGLDLDPEGLLPADTSARGFDNIAGSLTLSPTLLEAYTAAAGRVASLALGTWDSPEENVYIAPADSSQTLRLEGMPFNTRGGIAVTHTFPADGEYLFTLQNFGVGSFILGEKLEISIDGERVHLFDYEGIGLTQGMEADADGALEITLPVRAGSRRVGATFLATNYRPNLGAIEQFERKSIENNAIPQIQYHPVIGFLKITGPFNAVPAAETASMERILICRPANADEQPDCARRILSSLAEKAYRGFFTERDLEVLMQFYEMGHGMGGFKGGIELGLRRMLADPKFLVRVENEPAGLAPGESYRLNDLELASRLSFFLWSSIPDDELLALAKEGRLRDPRVLRDQAMRMLEDPKSVALVTNFAQQWLYLRNLPTTSPEAIYYPDWDAELRNGFQRETELFFESIIREDRSVVDLLDANHTYLNERLARHYGIPGIYGAHFRRVELPEAFSHRRGLLGKGSVLAVTFSENFRTSPVKRGVWVLENILGTPPPEPPANVPALEETQSDADVMTVRAQMTLHQQNEPCATCHKMMDPIGFALENFDADGKWRDFEGHPRKGSGRPVPIDSRVTLWDGSAAQGPDGLRVALLRYAPQFTRFMTEKLMTYALGRGVEYFDMPVIRAITRDAEADGYRFSSLIMNIVESDTFQMRRKAAPDSVR